MDKLTFIGQIHRHMRPHIAKLAKPQKIASCQNRDLIKPIPEELLKALRPWSKPTFLQGPQSFLVPKEAITIWTDASPEGWGAHTDTGLETSQL